MRSIENRLPLTMPRRGPSNVVPPTSQNRCALGSTVIWCGWRGWPSVNIIPDGKLSARSRFHRYGDTIMLEEIFFPRTVERYRAAPLVEQRERYLIHLRRTGARRQTLRKCANDQLSLVRLLKLKEGSTVRLSQIEAVTAIWSQPRGRRCDRSASSKAKARFVTHAVRWLRFLGWLDEPEREHHPHHANVAIFEKWLRQERGLSTATIQDYCRATDHFFYRLAGKGVLLSAVRMTDIDDVIAAEHKRGAWNRRTIHDFAQRLRAFFRFAEARGWCVRGIANGIMPPRFMRDEGVPKGLKRADVQRLLATTEGDRPVG